MKKISMGLAACASLFAVGAAFASNHKAPKAFASHTYFSVANAAGTAFTWSKVKPLPKTCQTTSLQVVCTITSTIATTTIANYNNIYPTLAVPARQATPSTLPTTTTVFKN